MEKTLIEIKKLQLGRVKENVSFKTLTTYKTGGNARAVIIPYDVSKLIKVLNILKNNKIPFKVLGNGSNVLASDNDYNGVIIKLSELKNITYLDDNKIKVEAGCNLIVLANMMCKRGLSGLEFACGIPGTVGGSIYMNAGAYLSDMSQVIFDVTFLDEDFNIKTLKREEMEFSYRKSPFSNEKFIILEATLKLSLGNAKEIIDLVNDRRERRIKAQPLEYPSAGSVFRNPEGNYAGKLIEDAGLKGKQIGGALISDKHANFIVNYNNATSDDIKRLMTLVEDEVYNKYKIRLHREQELFNWE